MTRWIFVDTETTGLSTQDRVIEIGAVEVVDRKFTDQNLHFYFNVPVEIHPDALKVHGIDKEFLASKPIFKQHAQDILDYLKGAEVIIHNASFDVRFLNYELSLSDMSISLEQHCTIIDSLSIARRMHPGVSNNLNSLCNRYGIDISERSFHGALKDAILLGKVYLGMTGGQLDLLDSQQNTGVRIPFGNYYNTQESLASLDQEAIVLAKIYEDTHKIEV